MIDVRSLSHEVTKLFCLSLKVLIAVLDRGFKQQDLFFQTPHYISGNPDQIIPLPSDLRERVVSRAGAGTDCGKAIQRLIDKLSENTGRKKKKKTDIGSLFDSVGMKKIGLDESLYAFKGQTGGASYIGAPKIRIGPARESMLKQTLSSVDSVSESYAFVVIHELIHNSGKNGQFNDVEVFRAARDILLQDGLEVPESTDNNELASQRINTSHLSRYCPSKK